MPEKILVIQTAFLGDVFLSIPLLKTIKKYHPNSNLMFLTRPGVKNFFIKHKIVDRCIEVNKKDPQSLKKAFAEMKRFNPDLIISPHQSFRSALWSWRLPAKVKIGFYKPWNFWAYTKRVRRNLNLHDVERQILLLEPLGIHFEDLSEEIKYPHFESLKEPNTQNFEDCLGAIAIAPGSQWPTKRWGVEGFIKCAENYLKQNKKVVLVGASAEEDLGRLIQSKVPEVKNFIGKTSVEELSQLLSVCAVLICNDSGTMHVASVMGTPVVSIFGPTVPAFGYYPWNKKSKIVETPLSCRPCGIHGHNRCPLGTHDCMKKIDSKDVIKSVDEVL